MDLPQAEPVGPNGVSRPPGPVALQRVDQFVGRTTNCFYDHLRFAAEFTPVVLCNTLSNREEFPLLEARTLMSSGFARRIWRRLIPHRLFPVDARSLRRLADIPYVFGKQAHLLVPERDAEAIAERLERYAAHPDLLVSDGQLVREQVDRELDVRKCAAQLDDLYDKIR